MPWRYVWTEATFSVVDSVRCILPSARLRTTHTLYRLYKKDDSSIGTRQKRKTIKGPDNPTSQLRPIMSTKCCSGDGEGRKDKGGGGGCGDKVAYESWCVTKKDDVCVCGEKVVCESCVWKRVCERWWLTKLCVKDGVWQSCVVCVTGGRREKEEDEECLKAVWQRGCARWRLPRRTQVPVAKCHACHAKRRWRQVPRLPRRHRRLKPTQARHPVP